jgi:GNAT superfamily N-acetyltransferase
MENATGYLELTLRTSPDAKAEIMRLYVEHERRNFVSSFHTRDVHDGVVRFLSDGAEGSAILHHEFSSPEAVAPTIAEQIASFARLRKNFEWKVYDTDRPDNLGAELVRQGFQAGERECFLVLDLSEAPPALFDAPEHDIREVHDRAGIQAAISVQEFRSEAERTQYIDALELELVRSPSSISIYTVYVAGRPAASARITFNASSPFAGLWGGATRPGHRKRGCYRALLGVRARQARQRGVRYLTIDASPMSQPIVERLGFQAITHTRPYEWRMGANR